MEESLNSLLNNSSTKQAYSFGKVIRFKKIKEKMIYLNLIIFLKQKDIHAIILGYGKNGNIIKI